jgi:hypothetical protein
MAAATRGGFAHDRFEARRKIEPQFLYEPPPGRRHEHQCFAVVGRDETHACARHVVPVIARHREAPDSRVDRSAPVRSDAVGLRPSSFRHRRIRAIGTDDDPGGNRPGATPALEHGARNAPTAVMLQPVETNAIRDLGS